MVILFLTIGYQAIYYFVNVDDGCMDTSIGLTPTFIGFSGGSGSGKTTLAAAIHERAWQA